MKSLMKLSAGLLFAWVISLVSCRKENSSGPVIVTQTNYPPIANAGADVSLDKQFCSSASFIVLDGRQSSDPEHFKLIYKWTKLSGPSCIIKDVNSSRTEVGYLDLG